MAEERADYSKMGSEINEILEKDPKANPWRHLLEKERLEVDRSEQQFETSQRILQMEKMANDTAVDKYLTNSIRKSIDELGEESPHKARININNKINYKNFKTEKKFQEDTPIETERPGPSNLTSTKPKMTKE